MKKLFYHTPLLLLLVFFSVQGFAQADTTIITDTTKNISKSPLLDKFYTRPKEDTVAAKPVIKSTGVQTKTAKTPVPVKQTQIEENKLTFPAPTRPAIAVTPTETPKIEMVPVDSITSVVAEAPIKTVPVIENPVTTPLSQSTIVADTKISMPVADTSRITRPVITTTTTVPPRIPVVKPEGFKRPRLGSSSPLYNTYEKNNKGAGSVTTLPKG